MWLGGVVGKPVDALILVLFFHESDVRVRTLPHHPAFSDFLTLFSPSTLPYGRESGLTFLASLGLC